MSLLVPIGPYNCSRSPVNEEEVKLITSDTGKPVLCAAPKLSNELEGLDVESGTFHGNETNRRIVEGLARAAGELPLASKGRDPKVGRWVTTSQGKFEIWVGRQARLICVEQDCNEFGYSWDHKRPDLYFYHSKSCKREGKKSYSRTFKIAEQKGEKGGPHLNIDLLTGMRDQAALLHLTPAGAGYKVFTRQLPKSFKPVSFFYSS